jgi:uncharacterized iron-regulated protein
VHADQERQRRVVARITRFAAAILVAYGGSAIAAQRIDATQAALAQAMQGHRIVLLGEVHDNAVQHALRLAALRELVERGARPAIAFEQFDREHQADIDRARRERPRDADYLIAQSKAANDWNWTLYRPFVQFALDRDLPIIAANLSRADAIRVAQDGWSAAFDPKTVQALRLDALPADFRGKQEREIAEGHCNQLPAEMLAPRANAQIARDLAMARSIDPYVERGVVLLAGNGHARRDIGVPFWLPREAMPQTISIGLVERDSDGSVPETADEFDVYVVTERAARDDPCKQLRTPAR